MFTTARLPKGFWSVDFSTTYILLSQMMEDCGKGRGMKGYSRGRSGIKKRLAGIFICFRT